MSATKTRQMTKASDLSAIATSHGWTVDAPWFCVNDCLVYAVKEGWELTFTVGSTLAVKGTYKGKKLSGKVVWEMIHGRGQ